MMVGTSTSYLDKRITGYILMFYNIYVHNYVDIYSHPFTSGPLNKIIGVIVCQILVIQIFTSSYRKNMTGATW